MFADEAGELAEHLIQAWNEAAADLGIRVSAPHALKTASGDVVSCEVFLPDFGSAHGAYLISAKAARRHRRALRDAGAWFAVEPARGAKGYDRGRFRDTLEDFGWFGAATAKPEWMREG